MVTHRGSHRASRLGLSVARPTLEAARQRFGTMQSRAAGLQNLELCRQTSLDPARCCPLPAWTKVIFQSVYHFGMVLADLIVAPSALTGSLSHFLQLGALGLDRGLIVLRLGLRQAVAELRVCADAHKRQVAQQVEAIFRDYGSRLLLVWVLRVEVLDRVSKGEPEVGLPLICFRWIGEEQIIELGEDDAVNAESFRRIGPTGAYSYAAIAAHFGIHLSTVGWIVRASMQRCEN